MLGQRLSTDGISKSLYKDIRLYFKKYDSYWKRDAVQKRLQNLGKSLLDHISSDIRGIEVGARISLRQLPRAQHRHAWFVGSTRGI